MRSFRPMLAPADCPAKNPEYFLKLKYPLLGSPKIDGIRCITREVQQLEYDGELTEIATGVYENKCISRELIELPSRQVQAMYANCLDLDGELTVGSPCAYGVYNLTQSHVMSRDKPHAELKFNVFDSTDDALCDLAFEERLEHATAMVAIYRKQNPLVAIEIVPHVMITCFEELIEFENTQLLAGYEGVMLRSPKSHYKYGRGTFKEGLNYKLKRSMDAEFLITGFEEGNTNQNALEISETGYAKRSSAKEGLVPANTLGKFVVDYNGQDMFVAPGAFTHAQRKYIWDNREDFKGQFLKVRFFGHGIKNLPRHPRAQGFRSKIDMSQL